MSCSIDGLSDVALLDAVKGLLGRNREVQAEFIAHLSEVDARKLYLGQACSSMFGYCTERLHLSESMAYRCIAAARLSRRVPDVLERLGDGRIHLTGLTVLAPHLTEDNADELLDRASHCSKRRIEVLVAEINPKPAVPDVVRKLPTPRFDPSASKLATATELAPVRVPAPSAKPAVVEPLAPARYKVEFTASAELKDKLERLQSLMQAKGADADLAAVVEAAVDQLLEKEEARRFARVKAPRKTVATSDTSAKSRAIPAAVKREVFKRDGGQCTFVDDQGRRCANDRPGELEFHHTQPFALGGDHRPEGVELRCRAHNQYQADLDFGTELMARHRSGPSKARETRFAWSSSSPQKRSALSRSLTLPWAGGTCSQGRCTGKNGIVPFPAAVSSFVHTDSSAKK